MDVFGFYDCSLDAPAGQAAMVTLWARSWRARGWNPRLITARHARRSKFFRALKDSPAAVPLISLIALHAVGGGWLSPLNVVNFGFTASFGKGLTKIPKRVQVVEYPHGVYQTSRSALEGLFLNKRGFHKSFMWCSRHGEDFWFRSPLVYFPDPTAALDCGRIL